MKMNIAHEKEHRRTMVSRGANPTSGAKASGWSGKFPIFQGRTSRRVIRAYQESKNSLYAEMITTLISDPAVALELGRRMAANAKRQPRLRKRFGVVWNRWLAERSPTKESSRSRV